eukprot:scaffold1954_cov268-Pinguiococcus_pyrenoidosus.AAC.233
MLIFRLSRDPPCSWTLYAGARRRTASTSSLFVSCGSALASSSGASFAEPGIAFLLRRVLSVLGAFLEGESSISPVIAQRPWLPKGPSCPKALSKARGPG